MQNRMLCGAVAAMALASLAPMERLHAAKPSSPDVPVAMLMRDNLADGIRSDGLGEYRHGLLNVRSVLNGNFLFDTNDNSRLDLGRRLHLDFHGQSTPVFSTLDVDVFIGSLGAAGNPSVDGDLRVMSLSQILLRRTRINWVDGNLQYHLRWDGPDNGHGFLAFTCTVHNGTVCTRWSVAPNGNGLAGLYSIATKGNATEIPHGTYSMPFEMTLDRQ